MWGNTLPKNRFLRFCVLMVHRYNKHNVAVQSAALAFYLLFMIFPFLIFISALLGLLDLNISGVMAFLAGFLPEEVVERLLDPNGPAALAGAKGSGIGFRNVHQRLRLTFGPAYGLTILSEPDDGTTVRIRLPALDEEAARRYRKE